jgi:hypothetical protein
MSRGDWWDSNRKRKRRVRERAMGQAVAAAQHQENLQVQECCQGAVLTAGS